MKVFIVEDEVELMDLYVEVLELDGHTVVGTAENGVEAIEKFAALEGCPGAIIMDYRMPIKNGIEATIEILKMHPGAKVILTTADYGVESEARNIGVAAFKMKPISLESLVDSVEKIGVQGELS